VSTERSLALAAALLGGLAFVAGDPIGRQNGRVDVNALARIVEREEDHVDAVELARWIRDRKPGLRVIDIRSAKEYAEYSIPGSERLDLTDVVRQNFEPTSTVVLYSEGGPHAAQGWFLLRARGLEHVYFLRGGLYEWLTEVIDLTLPSDATAEEKAHFKDVAELSRYFGGQPTISDRPKSLLDDVVVPAARGSSESHDVVRRVKRRGC
jgi:3-mercaptopyruvate sulfurtransferase SseA